MVNHKETQRLYVEESLAVRRQRSRGPALGTRAPVPVLGLSNQRRSIDFAPLHLATTTRSTSQSESGPANIDAPSMLRNWSHFHIGKQLPEIPIGLRLQLVPPSLIVIPIHLLTSATFL